MTDEDRELIPRPVSGAPSVISPAMTTASLARMLIERIGSAVLRDPLLLTDPTSPLLQLTVTVGTRLDGGVVLKTSTSRYAARGLPLARHVEVWIEDPTLPAPAPRQLLLTWHEPINQDPLRGACHPVTRVRKQPIGSAAPHAAWLDTVAEMLTGVQRWGQAWAVGGVQNTRPTPHLGPSQSTPRTVPLDPVTVDEEAEEQKTEPLALRLHAETHAWQEAGKAVDVAEARLSTLYRQARANGTAVMVELRDDAARIAHVEDWVRDGAPCDAPGLSEAQVLALTHQAHEAWQTVIEQRISKRLWQTQKETSCLLLYGAHTAGVHLQADTGGTIWRCYACGAIIPREDALKAQRLSTLPKQPASPDQDDQGAFLR
jgi:hypothetical protein